MRGIFALWVIFYHTKNAIFKVLGYLPLIPKGYLAVDAFFILSGFMLAFNYKERFKNSVIH
jgi:peptidoglycan/LPS O-acetylase OafA/YrhL